MATNVLQYTSYYFTRSTSALGAFLACLVEFFPPDLSRYRNRSLRFAFLWYISTRSFDFFHLFQTNYHGILGKNLPHPSEEPASAVGLSINPSGSWCAILLVCDEGFLGLGCGRPTSGDETSNSTCRAWDWRVMMSNVDPDASSFWSCAVLLVCAIAPSLTTFAKSLEFLNHVILSRQVPASWVKSKDLILITW